MRKRNHVDQTLMGTMALFGNFEAITLNLNIAA